MPTYITKTSQEIARVFRMAFPVREKPSFGLTQINQGFGQDFRTADGRWFYQEVIDHGLKGHNGLDIWALNGTIANACFDGEVKVAGADIDGGIEVRLWSQEFTVDSQRMMLEAIYYHLKTPLAKVGDRVTKNAPIALCDNTGRWTTGPHLHFGIKPLYWDGGAWSKDRTNGYLGCIDPEPLLEAGWDREPVDDRYGRPKNWLAEYRLRFKNSWVHRQLIKRGRLPLSLTSREVNALVYGAWGFEEVMNPALYVLWARRRKYV